MSVCKRICKGDRGANEGPAVWAFTRSGKRVLTCSCCEEHLVYRPVDVSTGAPNVIPGLVRKELRFEDISCGYDVVVLSDLK